MFVIPVERFDSTSFMEQRVAAAPKAVRGLLRSLLRYLYETTGPTNLPAKRFKPVEGLLEPAEVVLTRWLRTRTNGHLRTSYGKDSLLAARRSRYRCETCGFPDVRTLHLDHIDGRVSQTQFACLCANCHNLKSRPEWNGKRRYAN